MKIKGTKTEQVIIDITKEERKSLVIDYLKEKFFLYSAHCDGWISIKDKDLIDNWEEGGVTHSYFTHKVLRKATKKDKKILDILDLLEENK